MYACMHVGVWVLDYKHSVHTCLSALYLINVQDPACALKRVILVSTEFILLIQFPVGGRYYR